jgi:hypothetical protein
MTCPYCAGTGKRECWELIAEKEGKQIVVGVILAIYPECAIDLVLMSHELAATKSTLPCGQCAGNGAAATP